MSLFMMKTMLLITRPTEFQKENFKATKRLSI